MGKLVDESLVTIKPTAYYKMLCHVLRFGNKARDPRIYREVMGALVGYLTGEEKDSIKDVVVVDAFPISHGGQIEVAFKLEDYLPFEYINTQVTEKNPEMFVLGWYHSHPGLKIFFSSTDIKNQLGWQSELNPSGIGIVFDHTFLENQGDLGFRVFRLDDPKKSLNSGYHEVKAIVEPPDNLEFYEKISELIEKIYSNDPPILELNETTELFSDITFPPQSRIEGKRPQLDIDSTLSKLKEGLTSFIDLALRPLINALNTWSQEIIIKTNYNNAQMRKDLMELKTNLSKGIINLQKSFNYSLQDKLKDLDFYINDRLEIFDEHQLGIENSISQFNERLSEETLLLSEEIFKPLLFKIQSSFDDDLASLDTISDKNEFIFQNLANVDEELDNLVRILEPSKTRIMGELKDKQMLVLANFTKKLKSIEGNFTNLDKHIKKVVADLKAAILVLEGSRDPILNRVEKLENEKKNLHNTIRDLKNEREALQKQIRELKKGE